MCIYVTCVYVCGCSRCVLLPLFLHRLRRRTGSVHSVDPQLTLLKLETATLLIQDIPSGVKEVGWGGWGALGSTLFSHYGCEPPPLPAAANVHYVAVAPLSRLSFQQHVVCFPTCWSTDIEVRGHHVSDCQQVMRS